MPIVTRLSKDTFPICFIVAKNIPLVKLINFPFLYLNLSGSFQKLM